MQGFDLISVDWDTVGLMQAGQFKQETRYTEELVRWALKYGHIHGVLSLAADGVSRAVPQGHTTYSVAVRGCHAVAEGGRIIAIPDDANGTIRGNIEAQASVVPLYIGVSIVERAREPELRPTADIGLLQCGGLRPYYVLSADNHDTTVDWLQIAQFIKTPDGLQADVSYIPECMFLTSHARLAEHRATLSEQAAKLLRILMEHSTTSLPMSAIAAALAGSLGPAAVCIDDLMRPHAYVAHLAGVLTSQYFQLRTLPAPNHPAYRQATDAIDKTLANLRDRWTLGGALSEVRHCFEQLLVIYPLLLDSLDSSSSSTQTVRPYTIEPPQPVSRSVPQAARMKSQGWLK